MTAPAKIRSGRWPSKWITLVAPGPAAVRAYGAMGLFGVDLAVETRLTARRMALDYTLDTDCQGMIGAVAPRIKLVSSAE